MKKVLWFSLIALLIAFQYRLWVSDGGITYLFNLSGDIAAQESQNKTLQIRNDRLGARVQEYREGQDILEEQARSQLGMIKKDEVFIQVIEQAK